jgi:hypothetical protein
MTKLITLLLSAFLASGSTFAGDKDKEFRKMTLDGRGRVFFEDVFNVNRRSNMEILRYAVEFANDNGSPVTPKQIDQERNEVSFEYGFRLKKKEDFNLGISGLSATVTVGAKDERTRIEVHDITFTATGPCKGGPLESLLDCDAAKQGHIRNIERWMTEEIGERFYWDYKHFLEEAVTRKRTWE